MYLHFFVWHFDFWIIKPSPIHTVDCIVSYKLAMMPINAHPEGDIHKPRGQLRGGGGKQMTLISIIDQEGGGGQKYQNNYHVVYEWLRMTMNFWLSWPLSYGRSCLRHSKKSFKNSVIVTKNPNPKLWAIHNQRQREIAISLHWVQKMSKNPFFRKILKISVKNIFSRSFEKVKLCL